MPATLIDGRAVSEKVLAEVAETVKQLSLKPRLAIIRVGEDEASKSYIRLKEKACSKIGIKSVNHVLPEHTSEKQVIELVRELNAGSDNGILVQFPLPKHMDPRRVLEAIDPAKDVDGLHPLNLGKLLSGKDVLAPCTPRGIIRLLDEYGIPIAGSDTVVVGRSNIVGKPVAMLLMQRNATVTVCHSKTHGLGEHTRRADILVVAVGRAGLVNADMVKNGAVVVDVGMNRFGGKLVGDVDFDAVRQKASHITPVPGGVGPMTVAMLMRNTVEACKMQG